MVKDALNKTKAFLKAQFYPPCFASKYLVISLFYGRMENEKLSKYKQGLMRYVDDFLFMSKDKDQVMEFCNLMHKGFADYGMTVNPAKTLLNFKHSYNGFEFNFTENEWFPWCGLLINSRTLNVLSDYSKFQGLHLKYTFSADLNKSPGKIFLNKTLQWYHFNLGVLKTRHIRFTMTAN